MALRYFGPLLLLCAISLDGADFRPPAGTRPAARRPGAETVLPGGRVLTPIGRHWVTGPGAFGLAVKAGGKLAVTANGGPNRYSLTAIEESGPRAWRVRQMVARGDRPDEDGDEWKSVFLGLAFGSNGDLFASEGNSGRVRQLAMPRGRLVRTYELNQGDWRDSYSGDLVLDAERDILYVLNQANFRLAVFHTRSRKMIASVRTGRLPFRIALAPDRQRVYVTNVGMFEYKPIPGADKANARETGLPFPAFGFPSPESEKGVRRETAKGPVDVPPLGDPNVPESNSVAVFDVADPATPKLVKFVRTGAPFGPQSMGGSSPSGILATANAVYVSNANQDTISVIDPAKLEVTSEIALRIPGLEDFRGILPIGMAIHPASGWLLVAEAGINALGVIDVKSRKLIGHLPAHWFPTAVAVEGDDVFVSSAKGTGTGPNATRMGPMARSFQAERRAGTVGFFPIPGAEELGKLTAQVMANNGFVAQRTAPAPLPKELTHVVIIVKENRTFDEVLGDIESAANGPVNGAPELARFGLRGQAAPERGSLQQRLGRRHVNVSPNHHAMARQWAFSDNFYVDSEVSVDGHHWVVGSYPNVWTETTLWAAYGGQKNFRFPTNAPGRLLFAESNSSVHPEEQLEDGALWHHLERHNIPFRNFGEGFELAGVDEGSGLKPTGARYVTNVPMPAPLFHNTSREYPNYNMNIPDQFRANQFIKEIDELYVKTGKPLPRLLFLHLPGDHLANPRPEDGYPFRASFMADNDYALGRIMEYLTKSPWWKNMAVFITEDDAQGGVDHVDSHRTVMLVASPYARKNYVSHVNSSFPGMLKTVFRILGIPPLNLYDASAADLADCFQSTADVTPFELQKADAIIFDPAEARDPKDPKPSPRMDDPRVLQEEHRRRQ